MDYFKVGDIVQWYPKYNQAYFSAIPHKILKTVEGKAFVVQALEIAGGGYGWEDIVNLELLLVPNIPKDSIVVLKEEKDLAYRVRSVKEIQTKFGSEVSTSFRYDLVSVKNKHFRTVEGGPWEAANKFKRPFDFVIRWGKSGETLPGYEEMITPPVIRRVRGLVI